MSLFVWIGAFSCLFTFYLSFWNYLINNAKLIFLVHVCKAAKFRLTELRCRLEQLAACTGHLYCHFWFFNFLLGKACKFLSYACRAQLLTWTQWTMYWTSVLLFLNLWFLLCKVDPFLFGPYSRRLGPDGITKIIWCKSKHRQYIF